MKGRSRQQLQGKALRLTEALAAHRQYGQVEISLHMFNDPWYKGALYNWMLAADTGNPADLWFHRFPKIRLTLAFLGELKAEPIMGNPKYIHG